MFTLYMNSYKKKSDGLCHKGDYTKHQVMKHGIKGDWQLSILWRLTTNYDFYKMNKIG